MDEFDPAPTPDESRWQRDTDTFGRIYDVVLGTTTPTPYAAIADTAGSAATPSSRPRSRPLAGPMTDRSFEMSANPRATAP